MSEHFLRLLLLSPNSSCPILAPWHVFKFTLHYLLCSKTLGALTLWPIGQVKDSSVSPLRISPLLSCGPHSPVAATPGNYKLVHNNNSHMYPSISRSSLSAVSGVAEGLAGVKGQLINGSQFDKSQRLLSSSRAFRAPKKDHQDKCLILTALREGQTWSKM